MAVVLTILKILGIIILCILGLLILLLLLVLFVPVRYRMEGQYTEQAKEASGRIRWLFFRFIGHFDLETGFEGKAKIGFITVYRMRREIGKKPSEHSSKDAIDIEELEPEEIEQLEAELPPEEESDRTPKKPPEQKPKDAEAPPKLTEEAEKPAGTAGKTEETAKPAGTTDKPEEAAKPAGTVETQEEKKNPGEEFIDKMEKKREAMEKKRESVDRKLSHLVQFWERPATQRTFERGKKLLKKILKHLMPKKGLVQIHFGLSSAADTGMILARIARYYPLYGKWLVLTPDFYYKVFEAEGFVKGRIRLGSLAIPALLFYLKKDTRRTIKLLKKI